MSILTISLLGSPHFSLNQVPIQLPSSRAVALLGYLVTSRYPQTRETLANLLWTDSNQEQALAALRTTLWRLKRSGLDEWISWNRNEINVINREDLDVDVQNFQAYLERCDSHGHPPSSICIYCTSALTEAVALYRGEFMKGFNLTKASAFDDWRMQQSETFESMYLDALERLVKCHRTFGDFNLAIQYARTWVNADRLNENPYLQLLQLYSITGQRTSAVTIMKQYKNALYRELGLQPSEEIMALYRQIVSGRTTSVAKPKTKTPVMLIAEIEKADLFFARVGEKGDQILNTYVSFVRETSRRFGGKILQKKADNITLLFENGQSLHFAVSLHLMLKKAEWGISGPPSIRMVLFSTNSDYENAPNFALLTQGASSLLSIAWGGQVVFSDQTMHVLDLPTGGTVKDLGFHYLSQTDGSVHVFELLHPHLPATEHPPLQSRNQQINNIPLFEPVFVGREQELVELSHLVLSPSNRFVSLVGPGGVGKTRLVAEFATQSIDNFPDGIFFISLASIQDPKFIPIIVADALKFSFYGPTSHEDQLGEYLHRMKMLLIVDNFEHLRVEGAKFLVSLLSNTHFLKILVTSRERLNLIAESVMELHGFSVPDTQPAEEAEKLSPVKLFLQNAHKTLPRFSDKNNLQAVVQICKLVDGIPLSILLASSWVRVFSCAEIIEEINKNINFLSSSAPDLDPRHHSLNAVFDSSWKLLSEEERRIVRRLSIFHSSFSSKAAQAICFADPLVLSVLIDKSLLYIQQDGRYFMLTTFNQYASARLAEDESELVNTKTKFCEFYAEYCEQKQLELYSRQQVNALINMSYEIDNIRFAWEFLLETNRWDLIQKYKYALLVYHAIQGNFYQGGELFSSAFSKLNSENRPDLELDRASMLQLSTWMEFRRGFATKALSSMQECLDIFRCHKQTWELAMTFYYMAEINWTNGNRLEAKKLIGEAINWMQNEEIPQSTAQASMIAYFQAVLGRYLAGLGNYSLATQCFTASLETNKRIAIPYGMIYPLLGLANVAFHESDFHLSKNLYHQALAEAENIYDHRSILLIHNNLSDVYEAIGNLRESRQHLLTALKLCKESGDRRLTAVILNNLAYQKLRYDKKPAESIGTYQECLELFSELGDLRGTAYSSYDVSKAYLKIGLLEEAWRYCLYSLNIALTLGNNSMVLHSLHGFANYYASIGQNERALKICSIIINHPEAEEDTSKRALVSKVIIEATLSADLLHTLQSDKYSPQLQEVVDQILAEKPKHR